MYLCDYAAQPPFRRSVNRILVRGESVHQLERVIHAGPIRYDRGRRQDEKVMISGALTLLTNAVIAYNTWKLHEVLERSKAAGHPVPSDEMLTHIAPIAFRHINFQGTYRFPAIPGSTATFGTSLADCRWCLMTYPQETATFGTFR